MACKHFSPRYAHDREVLPLCCSVHMLQTLNFLHTFRQSPSCSSSYPCISSSIQLFIFALTDQFVCYFISRCSSWSTAPPQSCAWLPAPLQKQPSSSAPTSCCRPQSPSPSHSCACLVRARACVCASLSVVLDNNKWVFMVMCSKDKMSSLWDCMFVSLVGSASMYSEDPFRRHSSSC